MAQAAQELVCSVCGFKNAAETKRCVSCGARLEALLSADYTEDERRARRHQQETFQWKWVLIAFAVNFVLQAIALWVLPKVVSSYEPEGMAGIMVSLGVWFLGGVLVGAISPGKTFFEPAVGAFISVPPVVAYLVQYTQVREASVMTYVVGGFFGVMISLFGALLGERIQGTTRTQKA